MKVWSLPSGDPPRVKAIPARWASTGAATEMEMKEKGAAIEAKSSVVGCHYNCEPVVQTRAVRSGIPGLGRPAGLQPRIVVARLICVRTPP